MNELNKDKKYKLLFLLKILHQYVMKYKIKKNIFKE